MSAKAKFLRIQFRLHRITKKWLKSKLDSGDITQEEYDYIIS